MMKLIAWVFILFVSFPSWSAPLSSLQVYDDTVAIVTQKFYDQSFRGLNWPDLVSTYRKKVTPHSDSKELQEALNGLLAHLQASHTKFLTRDDQEYHGLKSIFSRRIDGDRYFQAGGRYENLSGKWFIRNVFAQSPLDQVGLQIGDEILLVNGHPLSPVQSFNTGSPVQIQYRRELNGTPKTVTLTPELASAQEVLLRATELSAEIHAIGDKRIGYFHLWSGTDDLFLQSLQKTVASMAQNTDALILDLRDGFGGAWTPYIQQFFDKDFETGAAIPMLYTKPVYVLINDGVRSGKEYLAFVFKEQKRATLIGTNTAGSFLGGQFFEIVPDQYSLYLAVLSDFTGRIEGRGVAPDVLVKSEIPYSKAADPQLQKALELAIKNINWSLCLRRGPES